MHPPLDYAHSEPPEASEQEFNSTAKSLLFGALMVLFAIGAIGIGLICLFLWATEARAHDAPTGWSYPFACCSNMDCRAIDPARVKETRSGYMMPTGEIIAYSGDKRLKDSPDGQMHWCSVVGAEDSRTLCFFAPPKSY